jgi:hypothetical protein
MDGISAAVGIWSTFKEVYLVSRFIARTLRSVSEAQTEQQELYDDFCHEYLYMKSAGLFFLLQGGKFNIDGLDEVCDCFACHAKDAAALLY